MADEGKDTNNDMEMSLRERRDKKLFDAISESYASKDTLPAQKIARIQRFEQTIRHLHLDSTENVLEIGCGAGFSARYLQGRFRRFTGIDYASNLIDYANVHNRVEQSQFVVANIKTFESDELFDAIFMIGVLHHIEEPVEALRSTLRLLKPGGILAINEPQGANPLIRMARSVRKRLDQTYSDEQVQYRAHTLRSEFIEAGFADIHLVPQGIFSTPFAEVSMPFQTLLSPISKTACWLDSTLEARFPKQLFPISWNLIAVGKREN